MIKPLVFIDILHLLQINITFISLYACYLLSKSIVCHYQLKPTERKT